MFLLYLYLYAVILVSLAATYLALFFGLDAGLDLLLGVRTTTGVRQTVARSVGMLLAAAPLWLGHWIWLHRALPNLADAKSSVLAFVHRFYLYALLGLMVLAVLGWGSAAATALVGVLIGAQQPGPEAVARFGTRFGMLFLSIALWVFHWQELAAIPPQEAAPPASGGQAVAPAAPVAPGEPQR
ncbi:MAG: hypothetical protein HY689_15015 [Chloroflexi bacterium]|nr:hypothetical protein [Chloroflexota bacterium]